MTLFVPEDSLTQAKLAAICPHPSLKDSSLEEAVAAVQTVEQLDRAFIRRTIAQHFSCEQMVEGYIRVYQQVLEQPQIQTTLSNQVVRQISIRESV